MTKLFWARGWEGFVIDKKWAQGNFRETLSMTKLLWAMCTRAFVIDKNGFQEKHIGFRQ